MDALIKNSSSIKVDDKTNKLINFSHLSHGQTLTLSFKWLFIIHHNHPEKTMSDFEPITPKYDSKLFATIGKELYLSEDLADVYFVFESKNKTSERVPAHKLLLMMGCVVFRVMFNGSWKEENEVHIIDTSPNAFKEFLQFFYTGEVVLTAFNVTAVMNLGRKYAVDECVAMCVKFLKNTLNESNVCIAYEVALLYEQDELKKACKTLIGLNTAAVLKSSDFLSCSRSTLAAILQLDWLTCSEVELFKAYMARTMAASKQNVLTKDAVKEHLGDLLYQIRFGSMSLQEFAALIPLYGDAFSYDEHKDIIQLIADEEFKPTFFNTKRAKRCEAETDYLQSEFNCDRALSSNDLVQPYFLRELEITKFSVSQSMLLKSFTCDKLQLFVGKKYLSLKSCLHAEYTIVEVSHAGCSKEAIELLHEEGFLKSKIFNKIILQKPVLIRPGYHYEIRIKVDSHEMLCVGGLVKSEVHMTSNGKTIQFYDDPLVGDDEASRSLIWELDFFVM